LQGSAQLEDAMAEHKTHDNHPHEHRRGCGHTAISHEGHTDYLHDGHLHRVHGDHVDESAIAVSTTNGSGCTPSHACGGHDAAHKHGNGCGHEAVPHGDHVDYLVGGHLHHAHGSHCDDHGVVVVATQA
jgi:hypothetical protein